MKRILFSIVSFCVLFSIIDTILIGDISDITQYFVSFFVCWSMITLLFAISVASFYVWIFFKKSKFTNHHVLESMRFGFIAGVFIMVFYLIGSHSWRFYDLDESIEKIENHNVKSTPSATLSTTSIELQEDKTTNIINNFDESYEIADNTYIVNAGGVWGGRANRMRNVGGQWGIVKDNRIIVPVSYDNLRESDSKKIIFMTRNQRFGLMDFSGNHITDFIFDDIKDFEGEYCKVEKNGQWGLINSSGEIVIEPSYESPWDFEIGDSDILATEDTLINLRRNKVISFPGYKFRSTVNCNTVVLEKESNGMMRLYNLREEEFTSDEYKEIQHHKECYYSISPNIGLPCPDLIVERSSGLLTSEGQVIVPMNKYDGIIVEDRLIKVCYNCTRSCGNACDCCCNIYNGQWGVLDKMGNKVLDVIYSEDELESKISQLY